MSDLAIDHLRAADLLAAVRLSTAAGWNQLESDWRRLLDLWPQSCLAGRLGGEVVATATLATYGHASAWVGMVLVDEARRRLGYGGAMLDAAIEAGRAAGVGEFGLDATDLGRPVYLKRGFRDAATIDRWVGTPSDVESIDEPGVRPVEPRDWDSLLALDARSTGADRGQLLRHLAGETGVRVVVHAPATHSAVMAFAFVRPGRTADHLGPVVADSALAATAVADAVIVGRAKVLVDAPDGRLRQWLEARGFQVRRRLSRMGTGDGHVPPLTGPGVFAAAALELG